MEVRAGWSRKRLAAFAWAARRLKARLEVQKSIFVDTMGGSRARSQGMSIKVGEEQAGTPVPR
jgi:hypothetical protein